MDNSDTVTSEIDIKGIAIKAVITIGGLWLATLLLLLTSANFRGTFGDMFGAVNSLFSGLALAGIIITILLQRQELALQRKELQYTRDELKRTADAQEKSEYALNRQAENLKMTAKLSALNTLVGYYSELEPRVRSGHADGHLGEVIATKERYLRQIEEILNQKQ